MFGIKRKIRKILRKLKYRKINSLIGGGSFIDDVSQIGSCCRIYGDIYESRLIGNNTVYGILSNCELGRFSYVGVESRLQYCKIGAFCSIGSNVNSVHGEHPTQKWVSTSPVFFSTLNQCGKSFVEEQRFDEFRWISKEKEIAIEIGNDVWIGDHVLILEGVKIGDGAVVGTGSVVVKNVPDYAVVGGVPAKVIKYRFDEEQIMKLKDMEWWNKDEKWLEDNAKKFEDITLFLGR